MNLNGDTGRMKEVLDKMLNAAAAGRDIIKGKAMGPQPKFFIIGDEPTMRDLIIGQPFSGPLSVVLTQAIASIQEKYECSEQDFYATYLIKSIYRQGELTEDMVVKEWAPCAQLEYHLSGCDSIVPLGRVAKLFVGHIAAIPAILQPYKPSLGAKIKSIWRTVKS